MELKNLLTKLKNKEEAPEQFFALEISDDIVKSAVWTVLDGHTKIVKIGPINQWDGKTSENLLNAVDKSISKASKNLEKEPSGVIFGLPETWIESEDILSEKKALLKKICQELELKPLGFVVTDTAVIKYLKIEEGTPPNAIFLRLSDSELNLSLVKLGKIIGVKLIGRSGDLGPDVEEGLSRFNKIDTLPSRMILYNGKKDFEEDKQQLMSYDWEEKLPFIHFPKVESLPENASIKAVALAGGSEVAKSLGFDIKPSPKKKHEPVPQKTEATAESFGFSPTDIAKNIKPLTKPLPPSIKKEPDLQTEVSNSVKPKFGLKLKIIGFFSKLLKTFSNLFSKLKSIFKFKKTSKTFTIISMAFITLFIGLFSAYWYIPKANIILYIEPKTIDENLTLTIDPKATILDPEKGILPGESVDISVKGSKSIPTTGISLIGDPAKGDITIYNKTDNTKTFSAGSVLIGPDNLKYTLDEEITATSSSSTDTGDGVTITFGKAIGKVTASSIGPDGNLSSGVSMSFKQFSEDNYSAKVIDGLSGGIAREVKAVSKEDQATLLLALTSNLKEQAASNLQQKLGAGLSLVDVKDQDDLISKSFSHDIDEETKNLTLQANLEYSALSYNQNDLNLLLQQAIKEKVPSNYEISQNSEVKIAPAILNQNNTATIDVDFKAKLIPKLDFTDIKNNLKGKYPNIIQDYLATLPSFIKADISITPNLPKKIKTLPRVTKNILIELKTE
ncbi:MAG: hypothetical protein U9Q63_03025 [Patescibacteria group bacterium]|nr:hypothetical protein [Patescibacteria group bacterium]